MFNNEEYKQSNIEFHSHVNKLCTQQIINKINQWNIYNFLQFLTLRDQKSNVNNILEKKKKFKIFLSTSIFKLFSLDSHISQLKMGREGGWIQYFISKK